MSDCDRVIEYLRKHKSLTVSECRDKIGTTELRKVISNLKNKGYIIEGIWESGINRVGVTTRYKRYYLIGEKTW